MSRNEQIGERMLRQLGGTCALMDVCRSSYILPGFVDSDEAQLLTLRLSRYVTPEALASLKLSALSLV